MQRVNAKRIQLLQKGEKTLKGPVVYWMSRDQRVEQNWALLFAQDLALEHKLPLIVIFTLADKYPGANLRHFDFLLSGLAEVETRLVEKNINFIPLKGDPVSALKSFISEHKVSTLIADFDPLKIKRFWQQSIISESSIPVYLVDAHNIVPCWVASDKEEYSAFTFRLKLKKQIANFLEPFPPLEKMPFSYTSTVKNNWSEINNNINCDKMVLPVTAFTPGYNEGMKIFRYFLENKFYTYALKRNNPNESNTSNLSPYLHFGQLSAQQLVIEITANYTHNENSESFLDELIVRRELSDNFCYYNTSYDKYEGFRNWSKITLEKHLEDQRDAIYTIEEFESAVTHDSLWNAAQMQLVKTGYMHGYMRMYWAKKILEWTSFPAEALAIANLLNDKYSLDGRDPNGYAGCAWSIGGVHDRPWQDRNIFGSIRYMNRNGCKRKFDVDLYISTVNQI